MRRPISAAFLPLALTAGGLLACSFTPRPGLPPADPPAAHAQAGGPADPASGIAARTAGLERRAGLLDLYVDARQGQVWVRLPPPGPDGTVGSYLYVHGLLTGFGSNPVGLDRGQQRDAKVITLRRLGRRLLVEQPNLR